MTLQRFDVLWASMHRSRTLRLWLLGLVLSAAAGAASATTITTLSTDFESPTFSATPVPPYTAAYIGGNCCQAGQGGWTGGFAGTVTTAQAHSGEQSMLTDCASPCGARVIKALDASQGEYPGGVAFEFTDGRDWWAQAYVYINSGGSGATFSLSNALGGCPQIAISGTGAPSFSWCFSGDSTQGSLGAGVLDQWVLLRMVHTADMGSHMSLGIYDANGNVKLAIDGGPYSGPQSSTTVTYAVVEGNAYWDDVSAGYGPAPAIVPAPAAVWLLGSGCLSLLARARRKTTA